VLGVTRVRRQASNDLSWRRRRANVSVRAAVLSLRADGERAGVEASRWKPPVAVALTPQLDRSGAGNATRSPLGVR
jgi:hypothetical protein